MHNRSTKTQGMAQAVRRHWLLLTVLALVFAVLLGGRPAFAGSAQPDFNQTVPPPTPTQPVPTPGDDGGDDDSSSEVPTPTPAPATPAVGGTPAPTGTLTASVQVVVLNVRQGPGTTFPVIGKLAQGDQVTVEGRNDAGDWWYVCCLPNSETRGWVSAALLTPNFTADQAAALPITASGPAPAATPEPTATPAAPATDAPAAGAPTTPGLQGTVAGVNLNVRSGPSTEDAVLGKLAGTDTVSVLGRNAGGDWLYICCIGAPPANGWVSAQFITPTFAAGDLPVVDAAGQPVTASETGAGEGAGTTTAGLSVVVVQQPPFAVQGREIALVYTVSNGGAEDLADVVLTSELPGPLTLVNATAGADGEVAQEGSTVTVTWAALPAGQSATATVRVRVAADVPNGTTFANLASVSTGSGETASSGLTIGMPPALLPEFW